MVGWIAIELMPGLYIDSVVDGSMSWWVYIHAYVMSYFFFWICRCGMGQLKGGSAQQKHPRRGMWKIRGEILPAETRVTGSLVLVPILCPVPGASGPIGWPAFKRLNFWGAFSLFGALFSGIFF